LVAISRLHAFLQEVAMRTSPRLVVVAFALIGVAGIGVAHAREPMNAANDPLKAGREVNEDGSVAVKSSNRLRRHGREVDDNIMQPGKSLGGPGRNIEEGTYDWDYVAHKPRRTLSDEPGEKKRSRRLPVEE
jgi:hypothetical protein